MGTTQLAWPCTSNKQFKAKRIYRMHFSSTILKHLVKLYSDIRNAFCFKTKHIWQVTANYLFILVTP